MSSSESSDELELDFIPKKIVIEPLQNPSSFRKGNESDRNTRLEMKRLTDDCEAKYPDLPEYSCGTSLEGLREIKWPGVIVSFAPSNPGCLALCSRGSSKKIKMQYKMWMAADYSMLLVYINKNVFYRKSAPIQIQRLHKTQSKSFTEGFTPKIKPKADSDSSEDEDVDRRLKEYGKTLASVVFSRWQTI